MGALGVEGVNGLADAGDDNWGVVDGDGNETAVFDFGRRSGQVKLFAILSFTL